MAQVLRFRGAAALAQSLTCGCQSLLASTASYARLEGVAGGVAFASGPATHEPSTSQGVQGLVSQRRWATGSASPSPPASSPPSGRRPQASAGGRGPQSSAQGRGQQQQQRGAPGQRSPTGANGPRQGFQGDNNSRGQELRNDILAADWAVEIADPADPEKKVHRDAMSMLDTAFIAQTLNTDALPLMEHLVPAADWRRFVAGDLSPQEQEDLVGRLTFALFRSREGEARLAKRHVEMTANPDYRLGDSLGHSPSTEDQPLPSALDVLTQQKDFFMQELGVSEEEYESIKADVAADFDATVRPDLQRPSAASQAAALGSVVEESVAVDHVHASAIKDKLEVLASNAFWPQSAKVSFARRLVKVLA